MPELGLEYFPSPPDDGHWDTRLKALHEYYLGSRRKWMWRRRELEDRGADPEECDALERNVIAPYREMEQAIRVAIDTGDLAPMNEPRLHDLLEHANAFVALYATSEDRAEYHSVICGPRGRFPRTLCDAEGKIRDRQAAFEQAIFEAKWNESGAQQPSEVTRRETHGIYRAHAKDGLYNTTGRLDAVAKARERVTDDSIAPLFRAGEPHYKPSGDFLSPMESAFSREAVRQMVLRAGLKPKHAQFAVRMVFDGATERDNPTAYKAIYRRREALTAEYQKLVQSR